MKWTITYLISFFCGASCVVFICYACNKGVEQKGTVLGGSAGADDIPSGCIDFSYGSNYVAPYMCPSTSYQVTADSAAIQAQRTIDSIINANTPSYKIIAQPPTYQCIGGVNHYVPVGVDIYGVSPTVFDATNELGKLTAPGVPGSFTIYVLDQSGPWGGGVFMNLTRGSWTRTFGFYPSNGSLGYNENGCSFSSPNVGGIFYDNSNLAYSVSIKINISGAQFKNLASYITNGLNTTNYNYNLLSFNAGTLAINAVGVVGVTLTAPSGLYTWYELGQCIRLLTTAPANTTINLKGGFTPVSAGTLL